MIKLVFATHNFHKVREVQEIIGQDVSLLSLDDIGCFDNIPETGLTFRENAKQKTDYLIQRYELDCFADDSGLEIDALNGEPGVYSARYSGTGNMEDNIGKVLNRLIGLPDENRSARFKTVISLNINQDQFFFEGVVEGRISEFEKGTEGFGYDSIFIPKGYNNTFAEMTSKEKNLISHRFIAVNKMARFLKSRL